MFVFSGRENAQIVGAKVTRHLHLRQVVLMAGDIRRIGRKVRARFSMYQR